jgi:hypothetical protein
MPIDTPKYAREERLAQDRAEERRRRSAKRREFSDAIRGGFEQKAQERRERQEARGIPTRAPINGKSPAAQHVERLGQEIDGINERLGDI